MIMNKYDFLVVKKQTNNNKKGRIKQVTAATDLSQWLMLAQHVRNEQKTNNLIPKYTHTHTHARKTESFGCLLKSKCTRTHTRNSNSPFTKQEDIN